MRRVRHVLRRVAGDAVRLREQLRAIAYLLVLHVAHGGHGERLHVERHGSEAFVLDLRRPSVVSVLTGLLCRRAVLLREERSR